MDAETPPIDAGPPRLDAFWTAIPADGPGLREGAGLAFDPRTQRLILFGGCRVLPEGGCYVDNEVWVLDLSSGLAQAEWTQLFPAGEAPRVTTKGLEVAYDTVSGRLLAVVTGVDELELWALEDANGLGAPRWRPLTATGTEAPSYRGDTVISYDSDRNLLYMFGGLQWDDFTAIGDMWVLENANGVDGFPQWRALPQAGSQPAARAYHSGTFAPSLSRMFVFGGSDNAGTLFSDSWSLDLGDTVTAQRLVDALPDRLVRNTVGYNPQRQTLLFLGCRGLTGSGPCRFGSVWHLRLENEYEPFWEVILPTDEDAPYAFAARHSSVYDAESDRLFFFSSADEAGEPLDVLWVLSNASVE